MSETIKNQKNQKIKNDNRPNLTWEQRNKQSIDYVTKLIEQNGKNVKYFVIEDDEIFRQSINPLLTFDKSILSLYKLDGKGIEYKDISEAKAAYKLIQEGIQELEKKLFELLAKGDNRFVSSIDSSYIKKQVFNVKKQNEKDEKKEKEKKQNEKIEKTKDKEIEKKVVKTTKKVITKDEKTDDTSKVAS